MKAHIDPRHELVEVAARFRHLRGEHGRAAPEGRARRGLEADMQDAVARFERRLASLPELAEPDRAAWREHLHHGAAAPEVPPAEEPLPGAEGRPDRPSGRRPWPR